MVHHTIKSRLNNIALVRKWVKGNTDEDFTPEFRKELLRKTMIIIGCTRQKAREYISLVLGDEE